MQPGDTRSSAWYRSRVAPGLTILLIFLATFRVTRLVIEDTFPPVGVPREWIVNWWDPDSEWAHRYETRTGHPARAHWGALGRSLRYLFSCPWCMSVWVGAGVVYAFTRFVEVPQPWAVWIASSAATGLLASLEEFLTADK